MDLPVELDVAGEELGVVVDVLRHGQRRAEERERD